MTPVAALFVMDRSVYHTIPGVDPWPVARDARQYTGPHPIVSHPPCSAWSRLWAMSGTRARPGDGDTCGALAVEQVRRWGGVLEQPAHSGLWRACYLPAPGLADLWGGRTLAINQSEWGHPGTKPTWLYIVGPGRLGAAPQPGRIGKHVTKLSKRQKFATPPALADALVELARKNERSAAR